MNDLQSWADALFDAYDGYNQLAYRVQQLTKIMPASEDKSERVRVLLDLRNRLGVPNPNWTTNPSEVFLSRVQGVSETQGREAPHAFASTLNQMDAALSAALVAGGTDPRVVRGADFTDTQVEYVQQNDGRSVAILIGVASSLPDGHPLLDAVRPEHRVNLAVGETGFVLGLGRPDNPTAPRGWYDVAEVKRQTLERRTREDREKEARRRKDELLREAEKERQQQDPRWQANEFKRQLRESQDVQAKLSREIEELKALLNK